MIPKRIEGSTRYLGAPQGWTPEQDGGECVHLAIRDEANPAPVMVSAWEPTPDELRRLNSGALIYLTVAGVQHPPVMLTVGEPITAFEHCQMCETETACTRAGKCQREAML